MGGIWRLVRSPASWCWVASLVVLGTYLETRHLSNETKRYMAGTECFVELNEKPSQSYEEHLWGIIRCQNVTLGFDEEMD